MLQQDSPEDYVIATGEMHTVREFVELVFSKLELDHELYVKHDPRYMRPTEVDALQGDASKARTQLGWQPRTSFTQLVDEMVANDLKLAQQELTLRQAGHDLAARGVAAQ